jgi:hypothetical protein
MGVRFIEKPTKTPSPSAYLMGTDENGIDGKFEQSALKDFFEADNKDSIGTLSDLQTTAKTNLVSAINEVNTAVNDEETERKNEIGTLADLQTMAKTNLVSAINEVNTAVNDEETERKNEIGTLSDLQTMAKTNLVSAINEVNTAVNDEKSAREAAIEALDASLVGGAGKYIESISETNGVLSATEKSFGAIAKSNTAPVTGDSVWKYNQLFFSHNIPRYVNGALGKDITAYYNDGTLWKRLNGTDGYSYLEDIYVGDYFQMSRAITCPNSYEGTIGSAWVTIAGINTLQGNGDTVDMMYNHLVMIPGKGEGGSFHFGRQAMNTTDTTTDGYKASRMRTSVLGPVVSAGSTASGATINQQLYAEFGSHLKTTRELITNALNANGVNRFGSASGCSSNWEWSSEQAILMSEVEVYGSTVWSSSGYDTGNAKVQLPLFRYSTKTLNNRSSWYWLKDIASAWAFCFVYRYGDAGYTGASYSHIFVRPRFVLAA